MKINKVYYLQLNLIYPKEHILFIRSTYGEYIKCSSHLIIQDLVRHLGSPNKLFSMLFRNVEDRIRTTFGFSLCTTSL